MIMEKKIFFGSLARMYKYVYSNKKGIINQL
jgi:hypothetical protein